MNEKDKFTFEEIFKQNEKRIHFHMHKLGIRDPHGEFYSEGLFAMWNAYRQYDPQKGPLSTYFNYTIRHHLIDSIRKKINSIENEEKFIEGEIRTAYDGNKYGDSKMPIMGSNDITITDEKLWEEAFVNVNINMYTFDCLRMYTFVLAPTIIAGRGTKKFNQTG